MIGLAQIFTFMFVMLGPLKVLGPFVHRTRGIDDQIVRRIALWAFVVASIAAVAGGFVGRALLSNWQVSTAALTLAAGIVFFIVALRQLLEQYEPARAAPAEPLPASPVAAACQFVFPTLLTPYGIAAVIALLAASPDPRRTVMIVVTVVFVLFLDLLAMLFARRILVGFTVIVLQVLGAVLAVLQVALAIQFILVGLRSLGLVQA
jgi:small neutral amino acid transporter SnatA (MarC family)